jgi:prepilin-type N-terminal cleavage/methylation domain-containing protein
MRQRGFTLIELLVVMAILAILAATLFPVFARAKERAKQTACLANTKQIGMATMMYIQDWDSEYPQAKQYSARCSQTSKSGDRPATIRCNKRTRALGRGDSQGRRLRFSAKIPVIFRFLC